MALVCGIDPSLTSTGIAILRGGRPVLLRSVGTTPDVKDWDHRVSRITRQCWNVVRLIESKGRPDLAMVEAPLTFDTGGDAYDRYALFVELMRQLQHWKTPTVVVNNLTRCKWATGKGGKSSKEITRGQHKREVLAAVRKTWEPWAAHIANDDIADGLTLAEIGARRVGDPLHFPLEPRNVRAMQTSINWPKVPALKSMKEVVG
ncbi:hypothetical protein VIMS_02467 [Mycobacterium marinum]|nr:hypothetical protein VIMS_02467 [Mycobacterium marinum]